MADRTVKVLGWGTGTSPATITATLDGKTVFFGSVDLVELSANNDSVQTAPTLFTFDIPMDFAGTKQMVISVSGAPVRFGQIVANYTEIDMDTITYSTGADVYADIVEPNEAGIGDPRGDSVIIDGQKYEADRQIGKGTWHWNVNPGSKFEHNITVSRAGLEE